MSDPRPWDDPADPKPQMFDAEGRWTEEGVAWVKRSGHRRRLYMEAHLEQGGSHE